MDLFSTNVVGSDGATVIYVRGEIDVATAGRLRDVIAPHMAPQRTIVLDLSGVEFMDASCVKVLAQARSSLTGHRGCLVLRNPSRIAHRVLSLTGIKFLISEER